jgi:hypothetical protein
MKKAKGVTFVLAFAAVAATELKYLVIKQYLTVE